MGLPGAVDASGLDTSRLLRVAAGVIVLVFFALLRLVRHGRGRHVPREPVASTGTEHLAFWVGDSATGIISAPAWGLGYFGQSHIIVRFMAIRSPRRDQLEDPDGRQCGGDRTDRRHASGPARDQLPRMSQTLFHPVVAGLVLAAVLGAIVSTLSSLLIVSPSALVEDLGNLVLNRRLSPRAQVLLGRAGVLVVAVVAVVAVLIALGRTETIFDLFGFARAGFGVAFGPIVVLSLYLSRLTGRDAGWSREPPSRSPRAGRSPWRTSCGRDRPGIRSGPGRGRRRQPDAAPPAGEIQTEYEEARRLANRQGAAPGGSTTWREWCAPRRTALTSSHRRL